MIDIVKMIQLRVVPSNVCEFYLKKYCEKNCNLSVMVRRDGGGSVRQNEDAVSHIPVFILNMVETFF